MSLPNRSPTKHPVSNRRRPAGRLRQGFRWTAWLFIALILLLANVRLWSPPPRLDQDRGLRAVLSRLQGIRHALDQGAGTDMQALFPEGYFFTYALYGLAWVEVGRSETVSDALRLRAHDEAVWAWHHLDQPNGKLVFDPDLSPPYGVFYLGWKNWLMGGILSLTAPDQRDPQLLHRFEQECRNLAQAFSSHSSPFLCSYPGMAWPCDSVVGMAALALHDQVISPDYTDLIDNWVSSLPRFTDPETGLLPHVVHPMSGKAVDEVRGTSQSIITRFLYEVDREAGLSHYQRCKESLERRFLGVPGLREYIGRWGRGDVDSGPLVLGFSASATVNWMGCARVVGDTATGLALAHAAEAAGFPFSTRSGTRYLFGLMPVGDAFLVWNEVSSSWIHPPGSRSFEGGPMHGYRFWLTGGSMLLCVLSCPRRIRTQSSKRRGSRSSRVHVS